jgi:outer membrane protein assembly factor BamB
MIPDGPAPRTARRVRRSTVVVVAVVVVIAVIGVVAVPFTLLRRRFGVLPKDRHIVEVLAHEAMLGDRPVGFERLGPPSSTVASRDPLYGSYRENIVLVADAVRIPQRKASMQLLELARADGWAVAGEECDERRQEYRFAGAKALGPIPAELEVDVRPSAGQAVAYVRVSAPHSANPRPPVAPRAEPGCLSRLADAPRTATTAPPPAARHAGILRAIDLGTGKLRWQTPCPVGADVLDGVRRSGPLLMTDCDPSSHAELRDATTGGVTCVLPQPVYAGTSATVDGSPAAPVVVASSTTSPTTAYGPDCRERWRSPRPVVPAPTEHVYGPGGGIVIVHLIDDDRWMRVDGETGAELWTVDCAGCGPPVLSGGLLLTGSPPAAVRALDPTTGATRWAREYEPDLGPKVSAAGAIALQWGHARDLGCIDAATGRDRGRTAAFGAVRDLTFARDIVLVRREGGVDILGTSTCRVTRAVDVPDTAALALGPTGFAVLDDHGLRWFDRAGGLRWSREVAGPTRTLAVAPDGSTVVVDDATNELTALDTASGAERWSSPIAAGSAHPVVIGDIVLVTA